MERRIKFRAKMTNEMAESVGCDGDRWVYGFYFKKLIAELIILTFVKNLGMKTCLNKYKI